MKLTVALAASGIFLGWNAPSTLLLLLGVMAVLIGVHHRNRPQPALARVRR